MTMTMNEFKESVFTTDILISKPNVPVFVAICIMAMVGSALFGIFFGRQEAQAVHLRERSEIVKNFSIVMQGKDAQIRDLSGVLIETQRSQTELLEEIVKTNDIVAIFIEARQNGRTISGADAEMLHRHVERIRVRLAADGAAAISVLPSSADGSR